MMGGWPSLASALLLSLIIAWGAPSFRRSWLLLFSFGERVGFNTASLSLLRRRNKCQGAALVVPLRHEKMQFLCAARPDQKATKQSFVSTFSAVGASRGYPSAFPRRACEPRDKHWVERRKSSFLAPQARGPRRARCWLGGVEIRAQRSGAR